MSLSYAYVRVSTREQNEDRQLIAVREAGIPRKRTFIDKQSGADFLRPSYSRLIRRLRPGDVMLITSIDRLGRNYEEIQEQWRFLVREKRIDICVLDMPLLDTRTAKDLIGTFVADLTLQILSFVAETERKNIKQRQREGIDAARERGVRFGRPEKNLDEEALKYIRQWRAGKISEREAVRFSGVSRATMYRLMKKKGL